MISIVYWFIVGMDTISITVTYDDREEAYIHNIHFYSRRSSSSESGVRVVVRGVMHAYAYKKIKINRVKYEIPSHQAQT
jgi:hypothetical protein